MNMNGVTHYINQLPLNSDFYSHAAAGACVGAVALTYSSPFMAITSAIAALSCFAVKQVKKTAEEKESNRIASEAKCQKLIRMASQCVNFDGNAYTPDIKEQMIQMLDALANEKHSVKQGGELRPVVVGLQQIFEHVIKVFTVLDELTFQGSIHTPMPPTPLCTEVNSSELSSVMAPSLMANINNMLTVKNRTITLRAILQMPTTKLYAVYSQGGLEKRAAKDQQTFNNEIETNQGKLVPVELAGEIDPELVGATYILIAEGKAFAFCIDAQQATEEVVEKWGIYCGPLEEEVILNRVNAAFGHILAKGGPDIKAEIFQDTGVKIL